MRKKKKEFPTNKVLSIALILAIAISVVGVVSAIDGININVENATMNFGGGEPGLSIGGTTNFDTLELSEDLTVGDDLTVTGDLAVTSTMTITGETSTQGLTQGGGCWATSTTATAHTVTEANLLAYNCFEITWNTANGTWTLPATSTMTTLLANAGDTRSWIFENATTTAAITHTTAAGTGIDLVSVTNADDVIDGTEYTQLTCTKQTDTDVVCVVTELLASD